MNLYGLYSWRNLSNQDNLKIHWLGRKLIILIGLISITAIIGLSICINQIFVILTNVATQILSLFDKSIHLPNLELDQHPIIDSTILVLSIVAMILMTRKAVENWLIWCLINLLSIWLYATQNVYLMSIEYVILLLIAIKGSIDWINKAKDKH
jgi:nicotinamide mononucleotide transporter